MYTYNLIITNEWNTGFTANLVITNLNEEAMKWSQLKFEAPFKISHLWNGQLLSENEGQYVVASTYWNNLIQPGESISIGFNGVKTEETDMQLSNLTLAGWGAPDSSSKPAPETVLPTISIDAAAIDEGSTDTTQNIRVSLSSASNETVSVQYSTADGSATAGEDYVSTTGTLTFAPGKTEKFISVQVLGDSQEEGDETLQVQLSSPTNSQLAVDSATLTLQNDDVASSDANEPSTSGEGHHVIFTVANDWGNGFVANIAIANYGDEPLNFQSLGVEAPFDIGNIWGASYTQSGSRFVFVPVEWNRQIMPGEKITFGFVGTKDPAVDPTPSNYEFNGMAVSQPDAPEPPPTITPAIAINSVTLSEASYASGDSSAQFQVTLSEASSETITVEYATEDGSAIAPSDYQAKQGMLTFAPGETEKVIAVAIVDDAEAEQSETFQVNLRNPVGATLDMAQGVATVLDNDPIVSEPGPTPDPTPTPEPTPGSPSTGQFNYAEALQKSFLFYEAQRSGVLPNDNRIEWRGDSAVDDGADVGVDLSGGYYDAGDHVKFGLPMAYTITMLSWGVEEYRPAYASIGQLDEALEAIRWGTDYLLKAHVTDGEATQAFWGQVGDGNVDHAYWGSPEAMTMERPAFKIDRQNPGSDLAAEATAALAAASLIFRSTDAAYADRLLENAEQLYEFADTYRGKYSDAIPNAQSFYNSWSGYYDELAWGAAWLYEATGNTEYLQQAETIYQNHLGGLNPGWTLNWDDKSYGAATLLAQQTGGDRYKQDVETWLDAWVEGSNGVQITSGGLRWIDQWGASRYAANTAFVAGVYADTIDDSNGAYSDLAETTMDYLLGDNPRNFSYVVGFGNDYPLQPHHRAAHGGDWSTFNDSAPNANILYGALVGGPNQANDFAYEDSRSNYITNEVAMDYNAGYTGALARMVDQFGGDPLSSNELSNLPGITVLDSAAAI